MEGTPQTAVCKGHDELRTMVIQTQIKLDHISLQITDLLQKLEESDERVRHLQIYGAKISQDNAEDIKELTKRMEGAESFIDGHKAASDEAAKIAAMISGSISAAGVVVGIIATWLLWGK